jgi:octaprenyl-diphosphate synthase
MMVNVGDMRVLQVLADATNIIAEGEVLQLMNCRNADIDEESYLQVIRYKTAKLFEAAGRLGSILAGATPEVEQAMAVYGSHLGTAFQLIDDALDYSGEAGVIGKNIGDDLAEGKPTLPLIYAMRKGTAEEAALVRRAVSSGGLAELEGVLAAISSSGALDYTRRQAEAEAEAARVALSVIPATQYRDSLIQLASFAVTRSH